MITIQDVQALKTMDVESIDLANEYWSPSEVGESRRMYFMGTFKRQCPDYNDKTKTVDLECAVFVEPDESGNGNHKTVENASKRLVAVFVNSEVPQGTPVQVTYQGRKPNKRNNNQSDRWTVQTLAAKGESDAGN
ncbi:hypothetical protein [Roseiconus lacunae]|uniref:Single-stranded DNA-binding protein n=1 Tax=Roseiconus lacunae TaxID=2605694 RepID=A0ABT7PFB8_9BACT|nr:hypothetical protein [Roseiconus lacunae]MCD0460030.1 hypothetical protein [Roseiconus lacunae]MDM4014936.1 hypothetical protein [Roseiconus lacunae]